MAAIAYTSLSALKTRMGITDTNSDTILGAVATACNEMIEGYIGAPIGDAGTATRTFDGNGEDVLWVRQGLRSIGTLEIADETDGTFSTMAATEYTLRPHDYDRPSGWPAWKIVLKDTAKTYGVFTPGFDTVRVTPGAGGGWGWATVPPELAAVADIMATRMFQARQAGEMMVVGNTDFGQAIVRFLPEPEYRAVLDRFRNMISPMFAI